MAKSKKTSSKNKTNQEVVFNYLKTPSYRTFYADGFYGGLTPKGMLYMEIFLERKPTPQIETYVVEGQGLQKKSESGKAGVAREIEAGIIMDYGTMIALKKWLDQKIDEFENTFLQQPKGEK